MTRILLYHPSPASSQQLCHALRGESDLEIVSQSDSLESTYAALVRSPCDLLLLSATLPQAEIQQLLQAINSLPTPCKLMMIDVPNDEAAILSCLEEGADGYVCEQEGVAELVKKIRSLTEEEFIIEPHVGASLIARISQLKQLVNELDGGNIARPQESYAELTQREWEVLGLLGQECSNQQIAEQLTIELGTVKNHVHNLLRKLDVCSRKQAAQLARQLFNQNGTEATAGQPAESAAKTIASPQAIAIKNWPSAKPPVYTDERRQVSYFKP